MFITAVTISTFFFMEFIAWFAHKYVMHGFLWSLHNDHHTKINHEHFFEKNDYFFLIFATPGFTGLFLGIHYNYPILLAIGIGISMYGVAYFLVHDIFIHQRFKLFKKANNFYFRAIRRAHKIHHKNLHKEDGECFGMLLVPFKYVQQELKRRHN